MAHTIDYVCSKINNLTCYKFEYSHWWKVYLKKNPLQDFLSSLNAVISTNESTEFITGHVGGNLEEELHYFAAKNGWEG